MKKTEASNAYIRRCHKTLKSWGAPLSEWICIDTYDFKEAGWYREKKDKGMFTCELCGCKNVRFVHEMHHKEYFENIYVGCICAGIMEGDILAARERERILLNRFNRKKNYLKRKWRVSINGNHTLRYKNHWLTITKSHYGDSGFGVICDNKSVWQYKGSRISNFLTAVHAAFDIVDPPSRGQKL